MMNETIMLIIKIGIIILAGIMLGLIMRKVNKFADKNIKENTEYKMKIEFYEDWWRMMNDKRLKEIEENLKKEDEYDLMSWGSKDTIKELLKHIKYLKNKVNKKWNLDAESVKNLQVGKTDS